MAESNSKIQRCPCGFWGTPETMGLCSKCYKDTQKKTDERVDSKSQSVSGPITGTPLAKALSHVASLPSTTRGSEQPKSSSSMETDSPLAKALAVEPEATIPEECAASSENQTSSNGSESNNNTRDGSEERDPDRVVQKNKKRCFKCNCKLELAIREIGRCKCDYVFCQLHRLPEQHDCLYDHKEKGREEARGKMVSPRKHIGTSLRRIDSDNS